MSATQDERIAEFMNHPPFAVVGASTDRRKCGNQLLRSFLRLDLEVFAINPGVGEIEGVLSFPKLMEAPRHPRAVSIVTAPENTAAILHEAAKLGVEHVWFEPGAESEEALAEAESLHLNVISGGPSLLDELQRRERERG